MSVSAATAMLISADTTMLESIAAYTMSVSAAAC